MRTPENKKNKSFASKPKEQIFQDGRVQTVRTCRCGDGQTPWRSIQPPDSHPLAGWAVEILDIMAPLVIKLFESPYLCCVSWETPPPPPPPPSPALGAVPLARAWEHWRKAVTREWTAGKLLNVTKMRFWGEKNGAATEACQLSPGPSFNNHRVPMLSRAGSGASLWW